MKNRSSEKFELTRENLQTNDLVDYQAGAIVSRTLIDKKSGTVTLFAFAQGQGLSEHSAPYDALVQVLEGRAEILIAKKLYRLKEGADSHAGPHSPRRQGAGQIKMQLTMIK